MTDSNAADQINRFDRLKQYARQRMDEIGIPGAAIGILIDGKTYTAGLGITSVENPLPVTEQTLFQIGSITKTFTGLLMLRLMEMGKLDLDAPVRTYLPTFRAQDEEASAAVTVRHLLTHTSGWEGDYFIDTGAGDDALPRYIDEMATLEQVAPLGYTFSYNNAGFYVAGAIIEAITGQRFEAALHDLVLKPLGLRHLYFDPADVMVHRFAVGHNVNMGENDEKEISVAKPWPLPRAAYAAGGIATCVTELLEYARFQLGDGTCTSGERLLMLGSMARLHSEQVAIGGAYDAVGLTWFIDHIDGARAIQHSGGTTGQISLLKILPNQQFAVAIFTNANRGGFLTRDVTRWALREFLGLHEPDPEIQAQPVAALEPFVGQYSRPYTDVELRLDDEQLVVQVTPKQGFPSQDVAPAPPSPPMPIALYDTDQLMVLDGPMRYSRAEIIRDENGEIGWLRLGSRIHRRMG